MWEEEVIGSVCVVTGSDGCTQTVYRTPWVLGVYCVEDIVGVGCVLCWVYPGY